MKEAFTTRRFLPRTLEVIDQINAILEEHQAQGFSLTLRQLFYQYVARGLMPNTLKTYTYLGATLRDGRLAGLIDWDAIEDRTRETHRWMTWADPATMIRTDAEQYAEDPWVEHDVRLFVWIEKAALVNIVEAACSEWSVPYFAVRGYNCLSEMYATGKEFRRLIDSGTGPVVLYLGDHDPSGINMPRVAERDLTMFAIESLDEGFVENRTRQRAIVLLRDGGEIQIEVRRVALNIDQVEQYNLPPNYPKETDKRSPAYVEEFATEECWELDALEPTIIDRLLREEIESFVDMRKWRAAKEKEQANRDTLASVAENWESVVSRLRRT
jgi:hypothetical protein